MADEQTMSESQQEREQVIENNRANDEKVPKQDDPAAQSDAEREGDDAATTGAGTGARAGEYS